MPSSTGCAKRWTMTPTTRPGVETLPRRGYRFIGSVEAPSAIALSESPAAWELPRAERGFPWLTTVAIVFLVIAARWLCVAPARR